MPRYTIDFDKAFDETLSDLVTNTDATTKADVIRRAVASYSYLKKEQRAHAGSKILVTNEKDIRKEIVLP